MTKIGRFNVAKISGLPTLYTEDMTVVHCCSTFILLS